MASVYVGFFFFQAEDGIRDVAVTGVQTCALPIYRLAPAVDDRLSESLGALPVGGIVQGHARARSSQGRCNPSAYAFGGACHYCHFLRQSTHNSPLFLIRLPAPPNLHRCELRLARMKISVYVPYAKECFETARQHSILHPERIVDNS